MHSSSQGRGQLFEWEPSSLASIIVQYALRILFAATPILKSATYRAESMSRIAPPGIHGALKIRSNRMTNKWSRLLLCVVFAGLMSAWAFAQDADADSNSKGSVRSITGCLSKSGGGDEYLLTANDGSTWEIHANSSVDL